MVLLMYLLAVQNDLKSYAYRTALVEILQSMMTTTPLGFGGVDLVNFGCSADCGTVLTSVVGMRFRATDNITWPWSRKIYRQNRFAWLEKLFRCCSALLIV
jgi:hypothetical protein